MAGGTIFTKQIESSPEQGTGDNNLIINPKYAYQVPFTFEDDWNEINIGVFLSFVSGDNLNAGFESETSAKDSGGTTNDTFSWIGITKNAQTKTLPQDAANQGFVGYMADQIDFRDSTATTLNKFALDGRSLGHAAGVSSYGESLLSSGDIGDASIGSNNQGSIMCIGLKDSATTYADTEGSGDFCSYFGIKYTVIDKGLSSQKIKMQMCQASVNGAHINESAHIFSNPSSVEVKRLLDGDQVVGPVTNDLTGLTFNNGSSAYDLPDSFFFYNGFSSAASQNVRPRIHAWSVKKIS